jgi:hypothetical protein
MRELPDDVAHEIISQRMEDNMRKAREEKAAKKEAERKEAAAKANSEAAR